MIDHRLMVVEPEFASTFKVAGRETNTLSPVIRQAWDTGTLRTLTRQPAHRGGRPHLDRRAHHRRRTQAAPDLDGGSQRLRQPVHLDARPPLQEASRRRQP